MPVQFDNINNLKLDGKTCKNFCKNKLKRWHFYDVLCCTGHGPLPRSWPRLFRRVTSCLCTRGSYVVKGHCWPLLPRAKGQTKGNSLSLFLQLSTDSADQTNLETHTHPTTPLCVCVCRQRGIRTWGESNFSCIKTIADSAEFNKGASRIKDQKSK